MKLDRVDVIRVLRRFKTSFVLSVASPGLAQTRPPDLSEMSLEDLMRIDITSVSRREQPASDAAAAIYVITHDAIRRSGMSTIPDLLRLAPGVNVAQVNFNKWAVSVRGFNALHSNKLLVLVDTQYDMRLGARHQLIAGAGYRFTSISERPALRAS